MRSFSQLAIASGFAGDLKLACKQKLTETVTRTFSVSGLTVTQAEKLEGLSTSNAFVASLPMAASVKGKETEKTGEHSFSQSSPLSGNVVAEEMELIGRAYASPAVPVDTVDTIPVNAAQAAQTVETAKPRKGKAN